MYTHNTFSNMFSFSVILQIYLEIKAFYKLFDVYVLANKVSIVESTFCLPIRPSLQSVVKEVKTFCAFSRQYFEHC